MDTQILEGFTKLDPAKAAELLPKFKENIYHLMELREKQFKLLKQVIFHVALKAMGYEAKDVQCYIYEHTFRRRKWSFDGGEHQWETVDAIDWKTGEVKQVTSAKPTGRIAGVKIKPQPGFEDLPGKVVKFPEPIDHWK